VLKVKVPQVEMVKEKEAVKAAAKVKVPKVKAVRATIWALKAREKAKEMVREKPKYLPRSLTNTEFQREFVTMRLLSKV
jgi:hypothetical protein